MNQLTEMPHFEAQPIRRVWHEEQWFYSVSDVVAVLTDSKDAKAYWRKLKQRESQLVTLCHGLKVPSSDGKMRKEDCATREGILRIIQSIPSKKAEPFKQWLAQVGEERLAESEDPQKALERAREYYRKLGYTEKWINQWSGPLLIGLYYRRVN